MKPPYRGDLPKIGQLETQNDADERYKYTGQREVVSIGLYYYGARYYDPSIGRFITEDSWPGEIANPQSQNLYIYVVNNPLKYIDPTGHFIQESSRQSLPGDDPYPGSSDVHTKSNNTNIEKPAINLPVINFMGTYNELKNTEEYKEWITPAVKKYIEINRQRMNEKEFNDYLKFVFEQSSHNLVPGYSEMNISLDSLINKFGDMLESKEIQFLLNKLPKDKQVHVVGFGYGGGGGKALGAQGSVYILVDDKGNIAGYQSLEVGAYIGIGGAAGPRLLFSKAENVHEMSGFFAGSFGGEVGYSGSTFDVGISISVDGTISTTMGYNLGANMYNVAVTAMYNPSLVYPSYYIGDTEFYQNTIKHIFEIIQLESITVNLE